MFSVTRKPPTYPRLRDLPAGSFAEVAVTLFSYSATWAQGDLVFRSHDGYVVNLTRGNVLSVYDANGLCIIPMVPGDTISLTIAEPVAASVPDSAESKAA